MKIDYWYRISDLATCQFSGILFIYDILSKDIVVNINNEKVALVGLSNIT